ncbi:acyl carrier protein [Paenibacillus albidus]|uniref:acyl carrier protein n=1 Tax=Paenibacillus albidus TaxID=2041023 RepID=UPI001BEC7E63|nr:acyl carrier protein [Paenibacillus albidus]MBT2291609.1 acyl carrier protein [Paenibacillus albidus]
MNRVEFVQHLEEQVIMPDIEGLITLETSLDGLVEWDSLAKISFLAFADRELDVNINPTQLENCKTILDLYNLVSEKIED